MVLDYPFYFLKFLVVAMVFCISCCYILDEYARFEKAYKSVRLGALKREAEGLRLALALSVN